MEPIWLNPMCHIPLAAHVVPGIKVDIAFTWTCSVIQPADLWPSRFTVLRVVFAAGASESWPGYGPIDGGQG